MFSKTETLFDTFCANLEMAVLIYVSQTRIAVVEMKNI